MAASPRRPLRLDVLEDRTVPALFGAAWPDAEHLTLSFVPDGTGIAGVSSRLFSTLGEGISASAWQNEILRAFQTWAVHANINIGIVADDGQAFGTPGPTQGSSVVGDIRIGMRNLAASMFSATVPFDWGDTWSGDIILNSSTSWDGQGPDLFTVMLQEAGHALGLSNDPDADSVMYDLYLGPRVGPNTVDIGRLQELYGHRREDRFDEHRGNDRANHATRIDFTTGTSVYTIDDAEGSIPSVVEADLTTMADVDYYEFRTPRNTTAFTVALRTSGISLLQAKITVLDDRGREMPVEIVPGTAPGDIIVSVANARGDETYRVKVERATDDVFGIGSYRLAVGARAVEAVAADLSPDYLDDTNGRNDTLERASRLRAVNRVIDNAQDAVTRARLSSASDVDFYSITAPSAPKHSESSLVASVWTQQSGSFRPVIQVFDREGRVLPAMVLTNRHGVYSIVVNDVVPKQRYYIRVSAGHPGESPAAGNYVLSLDFRPEVIRETSFVTGVLSEEQKQDFRTLTVLENQLFRFELADANLVVGPQVGLRMTIYDENGQVVFSMASTDGRTAIDDVWLDAGTYVIRVVAATADGSALTQTGYRLSSEGRSESIGLEATDTTTEPIPSSTQPPPDYQTTTTTTTYVYTYNTMDVYLAMYPFLLNAEDPYSDPWWN